MNLLSRLRSWLLRGAQVRLCPFHAEASPSLLVRGTYYHCAGCGRSGHVSELEVDLAQDPEYLEAFAAAKARPNHDTMMRVHGVLSKHHATTRAEADRLWREALGLLNRPDFGEE